MIWKSTPKVEEDLFYPKVKECIEAKDKKLVAEAFEEHLTVKRLIDQLKKLHDAVSGAIEGYIFPMQLWEQEVAGMTKEIFPEKIGISYTCRLIYLGVIYSKIRSCCRFCPVIAWSLPPTCRIQIKEGGPNVC